MTTKAKKSVKKEKQVVKSSTPATKRLDQGEMRKLEDLSSGLDYAKIQEKLHDQYAANVMLRKEKLLMEVTLMDHEMRRARELQQRQVEKIKSVSEKLQNYGNELKLKYDIKVAGHIKYDSKSGEIIDS